jgi:VIT1/CCC1 family predicted Fe2+/Mn2+ transporter
VGAVELGERRGIAIFACAGGVLAARITGRPVIRSVLRQLISTVVVVVIIYVIGHFVGAV